MVSSCCHQPVKRRKSGYVCSECQEVPFVVVPMQTIRRLKEEKAGPKPRKKTQAEILQERHDELQARQQAGDYDKVTLSDRARKMTGIFINQKRYPPVRMSAYARAMVSIKESKPRDSLIGIFSPLHLDRVYKPMYAPST